MVDEAARVLREVVHEWAAYCPNEVAECVLRAGASMAKAAGLDVIEFCRAEQRAIEGYWGWLAYALPDWWTYRWLIREL